MYNFDNTQHLHTFSGQPLTGASSVVGVLSKPLTWWASGRACEVMGWTHKDTPLTTRLTTAEQHLAKIKAMDTAAYLELLNTAYAAHSKKLTAAADAGTDMHAALEQYVLARIATHGEDQALGSDNPAVKWLMEWDEQQGGQWIWAEGHCYDEDRYIGGISDAGYQHKDGKRVLIDFKSSKEVYDSHLIQSAGYTLMVAKNGICDSKGQRILYPMTFDSIMIIPFGAKKIDKKLAITKEVKTYQDGFLAALTLYRIINNGFAPKE